ncbi:hypothetical protein ARC23_11175 [Stenotrophomonas beteli]|uniref:Secreted protein n=1 Tax=Stenotrophomonas beteli TaxID=3384461 RepID=A0A0R0BBE5_9GAMM|nr:hypothetical protein ARC23_11175 [Stenotrophomonas maltophilia]
MILHLFLMLHLTFASAFAVMLDGGCRGRRCGTVRGMDAAAELTGTYLQRVPQRLPLQPAPSRQERAALQSTCPARMCA